nr:response regulator transcription factor [Sinorhizobium meliloti]
MILIVEDNEELRCSLERHLSENGFRTISASDGFKGFKRFQTAKPDLVVLDHGPPGVDGFQLLAKIRHSGDTPVIMATAWSAHEDELKCYHLGADDYLPKPIHNAVLTERVKSLLKPREDRYANRPIHFGKLTIDEDEYTAFVDDPLGAIELKLTNSELKLLAHMARFPGQVFERADLIYGCFPDRNMHLKTIDSHVCNLKRKLAGAGIDGYLEHVRGVGYRLRNLNTNPMDA